MALQTLLRAAMPQNQDSSVGFYSDAGTGGYALPSLDLHDPAGAPSGVPTLNVPGFSGVDPSSRDALRRKVLEMMGNPPQVMAPVKPTMPAWRTQDLIKLLLGGSVAMATEGSAGLKALLKSYVHGKGEEADRKTQFDMQTQQAEQANRANLFNSGLGRARTELGFADEDYGDAQTERLRRESMDGKADIERMKQQFKLQGEQRKFEYEQQKSAQKALFSKLSPTARSVIAQRFGYDQATQDALAELTVEEELRKTQGKNASARTEYTNAKTDTENQMRPGRLEEQKAKLSRIRSQNQKDRAQITKWRRDHDLAVKRGRLAESKFEWQKQQPSGGTAIDTMRRRMEVDRAGLLAEAEAFKSQDPTFLGQSIPLSGGALKEIEREVAAIDAQLESLSSLTASSAAGPKDKASVRKEIAASSDKARANAAIRAIDAGADPEAVLKQFKSKKNA